MKSHTAATLRTSSPPTSCAQGFGRHRNISDKATTCPDCGCPVIDSCVNGLGLVPEAKPTQYVGSAMASAISVIAFICLNNLSSTHKFIGNTHGRYLELHVIFGVASYSILGVLFIACLVQSFKSNQASSFNVGCQLIANILLVGSVVMGSFESLNQWGAYWSWDPKQTWSFILCAVMSASTAYLATTGKNLQKYLAVSAFQLSLALLAFVVTSVANGFHNFVAINAITYLTDSFNLGMQQALMIFGVMTVAKGIIAIFAAKSASKKGYLFPVWLLYGFSFSVISLVHACLIPRRKNGFD